MNFNHFYQNNNYNTNHNMNNNMNDNYNYNEQKQQQQQQKQQQPEVINNAFAIMVSGESLNRNCLKISDDKYIMEINKPGLVKSFGISILNANELPDNLGFAIYFSLPPFNQFDFVGVIHNEYPSTIVESPWNDRKGITACDVVRIGFELKEKSFLKSLKDKSETENVQKQSMIAAIKTEFAMKVSNHLFNFMNSYVKTTDNGQMIIAPASCLDQWHQKFQKKYIKDKKFADPNLSNI